MSRFLLPVEQLAPGEAVGVACVSPMAPKSSRLAKLNNANSKTQEKLEKNKVKQKYTRSWLMRRAGG